MSGRYAIFDFELSRCQKTKTKYGTPTNPIIKLVRCVSTLFVNRKYSKVINCELILELAFGTF